MSQESLPTLWIAHPIESYITNSIVHYIVVRTTKNGTEHVWNPSGTIARYYTKSDADSVALKLNTPDIAHCSNCKSN